MPNQSLSRTLVSIGLLAFAALASAEDLPIVERLVDFGHRASEGRRIDTIILHSSYDALGQHPYSLEGILAEYRMVDVAAHYLIDREGTVFRLVREQDVAWHAGKGCMPDGRTGINAFSIGIELMNTTTDRCTEAQYAALRGLIAEIEARHEIRHILGHSQIAPQRKTDPWNFEWERLAVPDSAAVTDSDLPPGL